MVHARRCDVQRYLLSHTDILSTGRATVCCDGIGRDEDALEALKELADEVVLAVV
jgi:hypothetical protein